MKSEKKHPSGLPAWLLDPRMEKLLLIWIVVLSLLLAGLILYPAIMNYVNHLGAGTAPVEPLALAEEEEPLRLRLRTLSTPEPFPVMDAVYGWQRDGEKIYYVNQDGARLTGLQRVDGRLHFFLPDGTRASALGVDVSYYNEDINWQQVRAQGIDFAIVRIGGRSSAAHRQTV